MNSFNNKNNSQSSMNLINRIQSLNKETYMNLEYPINSIFEFINNSKEIYILHEKIESLSTEFDNVYNLVK